MRLKTRCLVAALAAVLCAVQAHAARSRGGATGPDFRETVKRATDRVFPAVVFVKCIRESHERGKKQSQELVASGVLISPRGEVLTNWHVVDKAIEVRCLLYDGRPFQAEVLGTDKDLDLALLRLGLEPEAADLPHASLADSSLLKEGDFVMAMGAPWGLARSVSIGIVSCTRRFLPENSEYSLWLQTDAAISPGNSGGPLVNTAGDVVGITARGAIIGGDLGFAVPSTTIRQILPRLREEGNVKWSWTGLKFQPIRDFERNVYFDATNGVLVAGTAPGSPARHAGIQDRDRLLRVNGTPVNGLTEEELPDLRRMIGLLPIGQTARFDLARDGREITVEVAPREKGRVEGEELDCPRWDLTVKAINQFDNPDLYFHRKEGVFIFGVKQPGNAGNAGLTMNDVILRIDGRPVTTPEDVKTIHKQSLENIAVKPRILFEILRNGMMRQVILDFSHDFERE